MVSLEGFDANAVEPVSFDVLPAGDYEACITASQMKATKDGVGSYLELKLQVLNGQFQNRVLFDRLNLKNASEKAVAIAKGTLSSICRAVGVLTPSDSSELHNKPMRIKITVKKSEEYGDKNEVKAYKPRGVQPTSGESQSSDWQPKTPDSNPF